MDIRTSDTGSSIFKELGLKTGGTSELIAAVKEGLPTRTFTALARMLSVSEATLARVTGISSTTLTRRKRAGQLSPEESEHVLRIAHLLDVATGVFEDIESAADWLKTENLSLGGRTPLDYAETEIGEREVENLLGRIDYGVYS
jgi:putative toxin-antitoxin system antitoxin component (TIGR02293 family)